MSDYDTYMQSAISQIREVFGLSATVTPAGGGDDVETTVTKSAERDERREDEQGQYDVRECDISVPVADVTIAVGAIITIGTDYWKVINGPNIESGMAEVTCRIDSTVNKRAEDSVHKVP